MKQKKAQVSTTVKFIILGIIFFVIIFTVYPMGEKAIKGLGNLFGLNVESCEETGISLQEYNDDIERALYTEEAKAAIIHLDEYIETCNFDIEDLEIGGSQAKAKSIEFAEELCRVGKFELSIAIYEGIYSDDKGHMYEPCKASLIEIMDSPEVTYSPSKGCWFYIINEETRGGFTYTQKNCECSNEDCTLTSAGDEIICKFITEAECFNSERQITLSDSTYATQEKKLKATLYKSEDNLLISKILSTGGNPFWNPEFTYSFENDTEYTLKFEYQSGGPLNLESVNFKDIITDCEDGCPVTGDQFPCKVGNTYVTDDPGYYVQNGTLVDSIEDCLNVCGNNILEQGEICDGTQISENHLKFFEYENEQNGRLKIHLKFNDPNVAQNCLVIKDLKKFYNEDIGDIKFQNTCTDDCKLNIIISGTEEDSNEETRTLSPFRLRLDEDLNSEEFEENKYTLGFTTLTRCSETITSYASLRKADAMNALANIDPYYSTNKYCYQQPISGNSNNLIIKYYVFGGGTGLCGLN